MRHAYVYYRIDPALRAHAAAQIDTLLHAVAGHCSRPPQRMQRCDDPETWMEVYEGVADFAAFSAALDVAARHVGCAAFIRGERHLECFMTG